MSDGGESPVLADVLVAVSALPGAFVWRHNTGAGHALGGQYITFGLKGSGDIIGAYRGRPLAIETKRPKGGRFSKHQRRFAVHWRAAGGIYIAATSAAAALEALDAIR